MKLDRYWILIFIVMMTVVGFLVFDNIISSLVFGIGSGGIFGLIFSGKKSKKEQQ